MHRLVKQHSKMPNTLDSLVRHVFQKIVVKMVEQSADIFGICYTYVFMKMLFHEA